MVTEEIKPALLKRPRDTKYMLLWYVLYMGKKQINFRSDKFVPEDVQDKLTELHCTTSNKKQLLKECAKLLTPYCDRIYKEAIIFLALSPEEQKVAMKLDGKFEKP